jgi:tetratricopeptide (TPR) repeat protein
MADKQLDSALHEFTAILALDPNNVEAKGDLGVVQYLEGNYAEASQNLRAALRLQPALWKAQAILGLCERAQGRFDSARTLLAKSFPHLQDPKLQIRAGMALAELDYQWRDLEKASAVLAVLQKLDPANVDVLYVIYRVHTDLATQARDNLALIAPNSARMHQVLAQHLFTEGDAKGAVAQYREAVRIDPHLPGAHFELGEAILKDSMSEGSQQNAQKEFETALAINPSDAKAEAQLGALFSLHGDVAAALSHYQRAAELSPDDPEAQVGLGKVLMSTGEPEKALQHLLAAVRIDPTNAQAHYRLAQLYRQLARASDAEREMGTFLELRQGEERLRSAYSQIYRQSGNSQALNPDIPQ